MPDKNVQLPDGRVVAFPDSMADADIAKVIKGQISMSAPSAQANQPGFGGGTLPAPSKIPPEMQGRPEQGFQKEDIPKQAKAAAEALGGAVGYEALPALKGLVGALVRALGSGIGAGSANLGAQALTPGQKVDPVESLKTAAGFSAGSLLGEVPGALREAQSYLKDLLFTSEGKVTPLGKAVTHPIDSGTEYAVRKVLGAPTPTPAPAKGASVPITQSPNFDPAAYRAGAATRSSQAPAAAPTSAPTEPSRIVPPSAGVPSSARTLQSYSRDILIKLARGGDIDALKELVRNPGDVDVESAVPNARYLLGTKPGATIGEQLKAKGQR